MGHAQRKTKKKRVIESTENLHLFAWSHTYVYMFLYVFLFTKMRKKACKHKYMTMQISANFLYFQ